MVSLREYGRKKMDKKRKKKKKWGDGGNFSVPIYIQMGDFNTGNFDKFCVSLRTPVTQRTIVERNDNRLSIHLFTCIPTLMPEFRKLPDRRLKIDESEEIPPRIDTSEMYVFSKVKLSPWKRTWSVRAFKFKSKIKFNSRSAVRSEIQIRLVVSAICARRSCRLSRVAAVLSVKKLSNAKLSLSTSDCPWNRRSDILITTALQRQQLRPITRI